MSKKDNIENSTIYLTDMLKLVAVKSAPVIQIVGWMKVKADTVNDVRFSFLTPAVRLEQNTLVDTFHAECLLKTQAGELITGIYKGDSKAVIEGKYVHSYSFQFSWEDIIKLSNAIVTDLKIMPPSGEGGTFEVDKKYQTNVSRLSQLLIRTKGSK